MAWLCDDSLVALSHCLFYIFRGCSILGLWDQGAPMVHWPLRSVTSGRKKESISEAQVSSSSCAPSSDDHLSISHPWMMTVILFNHGRLGIDDRWTVLHSPTDTSVAEGAGSFVCTGQSRWMAGVVTMVTNYQTIKISATLAEVLSWL